MRPFHYATIIAVLLAALCMVLALHGASWWWLVLVVVIYVHALVLGAIYIRWNFYIKSYSSAANVRHIALTFDDGPGAYTSHILDILKAYNVKAAFFNIGKNVLAHPQLVQRCHAEGHLVGNHSYNHGFNFDWQSANVMQQELEQTNAAIAQAIGVRPLLFRPPYGVTNPNLAKAVRRVGMYSIGWNIRSFDTTAKDPHLLLQNIINQLKGGDIILLHDNVAITADILSELIDRAQKNGFTFVRVDELLTIDAYRK